MDASGRESDPSPYERFGVSVAGRKPLLDFMVDALQMAGCRLINAPSPDHAPFQIIFETPEGERMGVLAYAFTANTRDTRNRPTDEHRFQVKYGTKQPGREYTLWQDPNTLFTTLLVGIDPEREIFVAADPVLHSPTKFFISIEFKASAVEQILSHGWHAWERERRRGSTEPVEVLVGGTKASFLRLIRFEREALGEDQGHRQLLAERVETPLALARGSALSSGQVHELAQEFQLSEAEVLDLIGTNRRLKMAVRGGVAEEHLVRRLRSIPGVTDCRRLDDEGRPDVELRFEESRLVTVECKNILRTRMADGTPKLDFQRTRASKNDPCSRYYSPADFDIVAACMHPVSEQWEFLFTLPNQLDPHKTCAGKLSNNVRIDDRWESQVETVLRSAAAR